MSRTFWFVAGAASGVYGVVRAKRVLEAFTPDGLGARVAAARTGLRLFTEEVAAGMQEREADLLAELRTETERDRLLEAAAPANRPDPATPQIAPTGSPTHGHR